MRLSQTTDVIGQMLPKLWQRILAFAGIWTLVGTLSALHWWFFPAGDYPYTWWHLLGVKLLVWYAWGGITLLILHLACRFPVVRPVRLLHAAILVLASVVITGLYLLTYSYLLQVGIRWHLPQNFNTDMFYFVMKAHSTFYYIAFWAVVAIEHAVIFYQRQHQQELQRSQLETEVSKARLQALRSQLEPHFLFNTLNTISSMIISDEREEANELMVRLSELLRFNFEHSDKQFLPLEKELQFSRLYLELMKARFEDRLEFGIKTDDNTGEVPVPTMILQPLVENAVKYSAAANGDQGKLRVEVSRDGDRVRIEVTNNRSVESAESGSGVGLSNTRERLQRIYGAQADLVIDESDDSVMAVITLPSSPEFARAHAHD